MLSSRPNIVHQEKKIILADSKIVRIGNHISQPLDSLFRKIQNDLGCTYVFYIYENLPYNKKIIYSSCWEWQNLLVNEKLINDCPVFKAGMASLSQGKNSIILPWNHIHCTTSKEKDITLLRSEFNIANGIGISHTDGLIREGIGFGADVNDFDFYSRIIANNLIYILLKRVRQLVLRNAKYAVIGRTLLN